MKLVNDFRLHAKSQGFIQLWPMPFILNHFSIKTVKFPTKALLEASEVFDLHHIYKQHFDILFGSGSIGRFHG